MAELSNSCVLAQNGKDFVYIFSDLNDYRRVYKHSFRNIKNYDSFKDLVKNRTRAFSIVANGVLAKWQD